MSSRIALSDNFCSFKFDCIYGIFDEYNPDIALMIPDENNGDTILGFLSKQEAMRFIDGGYRECIAEDNYLGYTEDELANIFDDMNGHILIKQLDHFEPVTIIARRKV